MPSIASIWMDVFCVCVCLITMPKINDTVWHHAEVGKSEYCYESLKCVLHDNTFFKIKFQTLPPKLKK